MRNQRICFQLMVDCWFGARWFGFLGSPYERDCYLGVSIESQTTGPQINNLPLVERMESKKTHLKQIMAGQPNPPNVPTQKQGFNKGFFYHFALKFEINC